MAKMFYTLEETKTALGKSEDEIKQLARENRLREFRDGPRLMFKADQVEQLKVEIGGGGDAISLAPAEDSPINLAGESKAGSGIGIGLADTPAGSGGTGSPVAAAPTKPDSKGETHFADIGLSGSLGGMVGSGVSATAKAAEKAPGSGTGLSNLAGSSGSGVGSGTGATRGGITIFDVDDSQKVDPSAQTAINAAIQDQGQISLESVGSGSGLLDLTREQDDTSLGAVLDDLTPSTGGKRSGGQAGSIALQETRAGDDLSIAPAGGLRAPMAAPVYYEAPDALGIGLGAASLAAAAIVCFGLFIIGAKLLGYSPEILSSLDWNAGNGKMYLVGAFGGTGLLGVVGLFVGKSAK